MHHDGTSASQFGPMDLERRAWLEKALNTAFQGGEDPNQIMKKAVTEIQEGRVSVGLDMLDHVSDFPDCAENLDKLGALKELVQLLRHSDTNVIKRTCEVLGLYLPNNPKIQMAAAINYACLDVLKESISKHVDDPEVTTCYIAVVCGLIRNVTALENSFLADDGVNFMCSTCLKSLTAGSVQKVCGLLLSLNQRHDLLTQRQTITELLCTVYVSPTLYMKNIQLFETVANLASGFVAIDAIQCVLSERRTWIESLPLESRSDFANELDVINLN